MSRTKTDQAIFDRRSGAPRQLHFWLAGKRFTSGLCLPLGSRPLSRCFWLFTCDKPCEWWIPDTQHPIPNTHSRPVGTWRDSQSSRIIVVLVSALIDSTSSSRRGWGFDVDGCRRRCLIRFRRTSDQSSVGLKACEVEHRVNGTTDRPPQLPNDRLADCKFDFNSDSSDSTGQEGETRADWPSECPSVCVALTSDCD